MQQARTEFFEKLKQSKAENRRASKATKTETEPAGEAKDDDSEDECWWYTKVRNTRSSGPPCGTDTDDDGVVFDLVRDKGGCLLYTSPSPRD